MTTGSVVGQSHRARGFPGYADGDWAEAFRGGEGLDVDEARLAGVQLEPSAEIATVTVDRESHVEIIFDDGKVCRFDLQELRRACPCAACRTARDRDEELGLADVQPTRLAIADAHLVGGYGLGVMWSDGHSTGIYPFVSLRRWCEAGRSTAGFPPDSGLPS